MRLLLTALASALALACSDATPAPTLPRPDAATDATPVTDVAATDVTAPDGTAPDGADTDGAAADAPPDVAAPSRLRVLFVGNSYTYVNDLPALLAAMARASGATAIEVDSVTVGGATLRNHWETNTAPQRIMAGGWDAVVLQEQSVTPVLNYTEFRTYGVRFASLITANRARPVYYATWPRAAGDAVYAQAWSGGSLPVFGRRLDQAYAQVGAMVAGSTVAHVGTAWMASLTANPTIDLYASDGSHPSVAGTWLAACVLYRALTGAAPPPAVDGAALGVSAADARTLRELAASQPP